MPPQTPADQAPRAKWNGDPEAPWPASGTFQQSPQTPPLHGLSPSWSCMASCGSLCPRSRAYPCCPGSDMCTSRQLVALIPALLTEGSLHGPEPS